MKNQAVRMSHSIPLQLLVLRNITYAGHCKHFAFVFVFVCVFVTVIVIGRMISPFLQWTMKDKIMWLFISVWQLEVEKGDADYGENQS